MLPNTDGLTVFMAILFPLAIAGCLAIGCGVAWLAWYLFHHVQSV